LKDIIRRQGMTGLDHLRFVTGIHPSTRPRYPDGMAAADPVTADPRRFSVRLPRPLWLGVAAGVSGEDRRHRGSELSVSL